MMPKIDSTAIRFAQPRSYYRLAKTNRDGKDRTVKNTEELPMNSDRGYYSDRSRPIRRVSISQP